MGNPLRKFRKAAGLTQERLAELANTSTAQISRLERGQRGLSKHWAIVLAPIVGTTWPVLLDVPGHGLAEASASFDGPPPAATAYEPDADEVLATIQEAVAAALAALRLPNTQTDILHISRSVERDIRKLDGIATFPATLDLRLSEAITKLQRKWQAAKASL